LLKALFGYRQSLYLFQVIAYILFLGIIGTVYFRSFKSPAPTNSQPSPKFKKVS
jgi:high-affinity iron transporter